jgi:hypothetical protein
MDNIIGRIYTTRGVKRSYEEDFISIEPNRNSYRQIKQIKDKRDLLHLEDTYHLTDCAFNTIFQFIRSKKKLYSLTEIERLRKETNSKFPICFTKTSAYVKFEYVVRTAIFVARHHEPKLEQFDTLNIRFNMDGTLTLRSCPGVRSDPPIKNNQKLILLFYSTISYIYFCSPSVLCVKTNIPVYTMVIRNPTTSKNCLRVIS